MVLWRAVMYYVDDEGIERREVGIYRSRCYLVEFDMIILESKLEKLSSKREFRFEIDTYQVPYPFL